MEKKDPEECEFVVALDTFVGKRKPVILHYLLQGETLRFNELRRLLPDITQRMLTLHLRELEEEDIIKRVVYPQIPPKVEYSITEYGKSLAPVMESIYQWGVAHVEHKKRKKENTLQKDSV
ncbi:helix-turn-helix transcriptional regulator [Paenibacillus sp. P26]|nr:helix-turn-helix transcriptional regulator [Paenibacillus sp. P26]UUZ91484.1 helix-turn-helix transcriptional regulator [Paenibacillus sp. P25]